MYSKGLLILEKWVPQGIDMEIETTIFKADQGEIS